MMAKARTPKRKAATKPARRKAASSRRQAGQSVILLVATRKGAWIYQSDSARKEWRVDGPHFLGHTVNHLVLDPRDGRTLLAAAKTGHLGPTIFRSTDRGRTWREASRPPAFAKAPEGEKGRAVDHTFWLTPANRDEPDVWYAGTSPQGLFRSADGGVNWDPFSSINEDPQYRKWMGTVQDGTPDGPKLHSIIIDPLDSKHMIFGMSGGGVHESRDGGISWQPILQGMEVVEGMDRSDATFHDPHCVRGCPSNPERLYQQNHCGIYRRDGSGEWVRIGRSMPKRVGDIGFPMVVHPRDADRVWVLPMDGTTVWPRTSPEGRPAVYTTGNAGKTWQRQDDGLPAAQAWWTVKRQAMTADLSAPLGIYFGTTSGELWMSRYEGERWNCIASHLPEIYALETAVVR